MANGCGIEQAVATNSFVASTSSSFLQKSNNIPLRRESARDREGSCKAQYFYGIPLYIMVSFLLK